MHGSGKKEVDLGHNNLAGVNEDILASGVNLVHVVKLYDTNLTRYRISTTFKSPIFTEFLSDRRHDNI